MPTQSQIRERITSKIIEGLKANTVPWRKPWTNDPNCGAASNVISKRGYRGINVLLLGFSEFQSRWWGTYRQWQSLGGQVQRRPKNVASGDWGTQVIFYKQVQKTKLDENDEEQTESFPLLRTYTLFNLDQVEGVALDHLRPSDEPQIQIPNFRAAQEAIDATDAEIRFGGNRAFYCKPIGTWPNHTGGDFIQVPQRRQFADVRDFYSTLLHEICHWSECRLDWRGSYALGELRAEIGLCFLANELGIPQSDDLENHNLYVAHWLEELDSDPKTIFRAAASASKAADFVLSFSRQLEPEAVAS